jgi:hypothetical protein
MGVSLEFGGKPGTPVPQVKPEHLKAAFELCRKHSSMAPQDAAKSLDAIELGQTAGAGPSSSGTPTRTI